MSALGLRRLIMKKDKYAIFDALNPFFEIVQEGLTGLVDGKHFFDTIADDALFDYRYNFPGWPLTVRGRADLMDQFSGYGDTIRLHSADGLVVRRSQDSRVVILEYEVHGKILSTGVSYDNRLISVIFESLFETFVAFLIGSGHLATDLYVSEMPPRHRLSPHSEYFFPWLEPTPGASFVQSWSKPRRQPPFPVILLAPAEGCSTRDYRNHD